MSYCLRCGGPFVPARNQKYDTARCREADQRDRRRLGDSCSISGCLQPVHARGWCLKHYKRWHNTGDPNVLRHIPGWTVDKSTGYRRRLVDGRLVYEHRYVMELHLGRPLERREQVHHLDGDRTNNNIDNLAVMRLGDHQRFHGSHRSAKPADRKQEV